MNDQDCCGNGYLILIIVSWEQHSEGPGAAAVSKRKHLGTLVFGQLDKCSCIWYILKNFVVVYLMFKFNGHQVSHLATLCGGDLKTPQIRGCLMCEEEFWKKCLKNWFLATALRRSAAVCLLMKWEGLQVHGFQILLSFRNYTNEIVLESPLNNIKQIKAVLLIEAEFGSLPTTRW